MWQRTLSEFVPLISPIRFAATQKLSSLHAKTVLRRSRTHLEIHLPDWEKSLKIPYVWLRDNCFCSQCYSRNTKQKINDVFSIPLDIQPCQFSLECEELKIKCRSFY